MFDAGICTVYSLISSSNNGAMMKEVLKEKTSSYFGLLKLGINRVYLAKKSDEKIIRNIFNVTVALLVVLNIYNAVTALL